MIDLNKCVDLFSKLKKHGLLERNLKSLYILHHRSLLPFYFKSFLHHLSLFFISLLFFLFRSAWFFVDDFFCSCSCRGWLCKISRCCRCNVEQNLRHLQKFASRSILHLRSLQNSFKSQKYFVGSNSSSINAFDDLKNFAKVLFLVFLQFIIRVHGRSNQFEAHSIIWWLITFLFTFLRRFFLSFKL